LGENETVDGSDGTNKKYNSTVIDGKFRVSGNEEKKGLSDS
jgi:hypothetical protein